MRRFAEWAAYLGLAALAAAIVVPYARPQWGNVRLGLLIAGLVLIVIYLAGFLGGLRGRLGGRTARYGLNTAIAVILVIGAAGLVEAISYRHSARFDLTENKRHSLSPQTVQILKGLKTPVNAVAFYRGDQPGKRVAEDLLKQYARYGGKQFTWRVVDPDREPGLARRYGVESYGTVVLETKAKSEKVTDAEEEKVTNGLLKVTREGKPTVYVLQGHGERDLGNTDRPGFSEAKSALERANYQVKPLVLAREGKVPADAAVVIVPGPKTDLFQPELDALDAYLKKGGKVLAMIDPFQSEGLKRYLAGWGIEAGDNLVIEPNPIGRLFGIGPEVPIVQQYDQHPITREMAGVSTLFPLARTVGPEKKPPQGVMVQPLAETSPQSWGETDRAALNRGEAKPDPADAKGPLTVASVATKDKDRLVVYGTSNIVANQFLNIQGNRDFFLNTVSWLAEQDDQISIRPREAKQEPVFLSSQQAQMVFLLPVILLPGVVLVGGITAGVRRRAAK